MKEEPPRVAVTAGGSARWSGQGVEGWAALATSTCQVCVGFINIEQAHGRRGGRTAWAPSHVPVHPSPPVCLLQQPSDYTVHPKVLGPPPVYIRSSNCHNPVSEASHPPISNNSAGVGAASGSYPGSCPGVLAFVKLGAMGVAGHMVPVELDRK